MFLPLENSENMVQFSPFRPEFAKRPFKKISLRNKLKLKTLGFSPNKGPTMPCYKKGNLLIFFFFKEKEKLNRKCEFMYYFGDKPNIERNTLKTVNEWIKELPILLEKLNVKKIDKKEQTKIWHKQLKEKKMFRLKNRMLREDREIKNGGQMGNRITENRIH